MEGLDPIKDAEQKEYFLHLKDLTGELVMGVYSKMSGDVEEALKLQDLRQLLGRFPEYERSMWDWGQFFNKKHQLHNFQPGTNMGMFDAELSPSTNTLIIKCRLNFRFVRGSLLAFPEAKPGDLEWTAGEKQAWKLNFLTQANVKWTYKHRIWCLRDWWESYRLRARIIFEEDDQQPHYHFRVAKIPRFLIDDIPNTHHSWVRSAQKKWGGGCEPGVVYTHSNGLLVPYAGAASEAIHLTGHLLGLADEDVSGGNPAHDLLAQKLGAGVAHEGVDERMMSRGDKITDAYAAPFLEVLSKLTGAGPWGLMRRRSRVVPWDKFNRPGDFYSDDEGIPHEKKEYWK